MLECKSSKIALGIFLNYWGGQWPPTSYSPEYCGAWSLHATLHIMGKEFSETGSRFQLFSEKKSGSICDFSERQFAKNHR